MSEELGIEWLPPEVLRELLTIDEDLELTAESTSTSGQSTKPTESANMVVARTSECSDIGMDTAKTLEDIDATEGKLSVYGKAIVVEWIKEFSQTRKMERILSQYSKNCLQANKFFDASAKVAHPAFALIKIIKKVCQPTDSADEWKGGEITVRKLHLRLYRLICFASRFKSNWTQPSYRLAVNDTEKWLPDSLKGEK